MTLQEERTLLKHFEDLSFESFKFHGYEVKRRVISYGLHYSFESKSLSPSAPLPSFLEPLREKAAEWIHRPPQAFAEVLLTEYRPGTEIGWHRDAPPFGEVVGISLLNPCMFQLRRRSENRVLKVFLQPRSAYLLSGEARDEWEHHIPAVKDLRYSITFRTIRDNK